MVTCIRQVTILILVDGFLQYNWWKKIKACVKVTILILVDGFLQYYLLFNLGDKYEESQSLF